MPIVTIDGRQIEVEQGTSVIQAADRLGVEIPRFCYHPDLKPEGNCRMCLVDVEGFQKPVVACATPVMDGMVVRTPHTSAVASRAVHGVLEFLLVNHPLDCPICDQAGECSLQDFYMRPDYGQHPSRVDPVEKVHKRKRVSLGSRIVLDAERCVMCSRCVRFSEEVSGYAELQFVRRGNHVELTPFEDRALQDPYAGNLADVCPVGALTSQDFRFKRRVWHLSHTDSICAGCSTGCNVRIDHFQGRIERVVPRRNPSVNRSWLCDEGRLSFKSLDAAPRLAHPRRGDSRLDWSEATALADRSLRAATAAKGLPLAALACASATNESLWLFRQYVEAVFPQHRLEFRLDRESEAASERQDTLLRRVDKHPNTMGALHLGFSHGVGLAGLVALAEKGEFGALLMLYHPPLVGEENPDTTDLLQRLLAAVRESVVLTTHDVPYLAQAKVLLPVAAWSEEEGTYTNYQGVTQYAGRAVSSQGATRPAADVLGDFWQYATSTRRQTGSEHVFHEIAASVPAFRGLSYAMLESRTATVYPPEGRMHYGQEGFAGR